MDLIALGILGTAALAAAANPPKAVPWDPPSDTRDRDQFCEKLYDADNAVCRGLTDPGARGRCFASATERLGACKHRTFIPPLITW